MLTFGFFIHRIFGRLLRFCHLKYVANLSLRNVTLCALLQLMNLFHLQVFHGSHMGHQSRLARGGELAECAVVRSFFFGDRGLHFLQVCKQHSSRLMLLIRYMHLQFVRTVCIEIASIASQFHRINAGQETEFPFIGRTSLLDVIDMAETL